MYRVAYNLCVDHYRENKAGRVQTVPEIRDPGSPDANPETIYLARESMARFLAAFRNLPPEGRALLLLRERNNASYQEIPATTGCTVEGVRSRLYRTRAALHRALERGETN
ncbi:MAG: sigma-70 family RNA polymerase sigma factor [Peptococcaceae bacterium]|nr:sigma-70 family RNA polymerase sigma factor [Peptococcaceae bacterium]